MKVRPSVKKICTKCKVVRRRGVVRVGRLRCETHRGARYSACSRRRQAASAPPACLRTIGPSSGV